ncbi:MAG: PAS domain S-box-containing protein [Enterobacterales bacterium]|jgi:PAS domain S-box-containing protein
MSQFRKTSINKQMSVMFMLILIISLLGSGSAFVFFEYINKKNDFVEGLKAVAEITASRSVAALELEDIGNLQNTLDSLHSIKSITLACAYQAEDKLLAFYKSVTSSRECFNKINKTGVYFSTDNVQIVEVSLRGDSSVGSFVINASLDKLNEATVFSIMIMLAITIITSLLGYQLFRMSQKTITEPILSLAKYANRIAKQKEYRLTDIPDCALEITTLYKAFGNMLDRIKEEHDELTRSESGLQSIINGSLSSIIIKTIDGKYTFSNHTFQQLLNVTAEEVLGLTNKDFFTEKEVGLQRIQEQRLVQHKKPIEFEEAIIFEDGIHHVYTVNIPLFDSDNKIYAICSMSTDISESKKHAEILKRSQKMEALGKLTGGIAHDYNNMLAVILGFAHLIESAKESPKKISGYAEEIKKAGNRGTKLTSRLLAFSRTKLAEATEVNVTKLINTERHMLEKTLTARIALHTELDDDIWSVWLDQDDLNDAILNICINAMHAIDDNGELTICSSNVRVNEDLADKIGLSPGNYVLIQITDDGAGMDDEVMSHIFDPFFSTKGEKGTGLGLSQVYGFVQRSLGAIKVESELNIGSSFSLYFPRNQVNERESDIVKTEQLSDYRGTESILVVDDEIALLLLAEEILIRAGYTVVTAKSAESALEQLKKSDFDLLLSDVIMPGMSGYGLAKEAREKYPAMKIQLVSGYDSNIPANEKDAALQSRLIGKPFGDIKLLRTIRKLLNEN